MAQVIGNLQDHIGKLKIMLPLVRDPAISEKGSQDVAGYGASRIAVTVMVHCCNDASRKIIFMTERTIQGDSQCLFSNPTFSQPMDVIKVAPAVLREINRTIYNRLKLRKSCTAVQAL